MTSHPAWCDQQHTVPGHHCHVGFIEEVSVSITQGSGGGVWFAIGPTLVDEFDARGIASLLGQLGHHELADLIGKAIDLINSEAAPGATDAASDNQTPGKE